MQFVDNVRNMKKFILIAASLFAAVTSAMAGGYFQNTNQSITFIRKPAQNAAIGVQAAYFNPAGIGFLDNGWHFEAGWQMPTQRRYVTSDYAPFAYGAAHPGTSEVKYTGKTFVPFLPTLSAAYVHDKLFASFHFGAITGGGACSFDDGLGSFEAPIAALAGVFNTLGAAAGKAPGAYAADISFTGKQYNLAGQLMVGYKITDNLSVSAGIRMNHIFNDYDGAIENVTFNGNSFGTTVQAFGLPASAGEMVDNMVQMKIKAHNDCDAFNPIIGIDYRTGKLNFSARYEFRTAVRLKNSSDNDVPDMAVAAAYDPSKNPTVRADIPASLSLGVQYEIIPGLRTELDWNYYFDKQANVFGGNDASGAALNKQEKLGSNPWEIAFGAEYDINEKWTVSAGANNLNLYLGDGKAYIGDTDFSTSSVSVGIGGRYRFSKKVAVDFGYYKAFYANWTKNYADYSGLSSMSGSMSGMLEGLAKAHPELAPAIGQIGAQMTTGIPATVKYDRDSWLVGIGIVLDF